MYSTAIKPQPSSKQHYHKECIVQLSESSTYHQKPDTKITELFFHGSIDQKPANNETRTKVLKDRPRLYICNHHYTPTHVNKNFWKPIEFWPE